LNDTIIAMKATTSFIHSSPWPAF